MNYPTKVVLIAVFLLSAIWGRVFLLEREHFERAEEYLIKGDLKFAVREYDAAMHFYTPFSPYREKAAMRLWDIGAAMENEGRADTALVAYSSIRSSFYAARWLITPGRQWIEKCNKKMAALNVKIALMEGLFADEEAARWKQKYLELLDEDRSPSTLWSSFALLGFFGWTASVVFMIFKGFNDKGVIRGRSMLYGVSAFTVTFALWVVSLMRA